MESSLGARRKYDAAGNVLQTNRPYNPGAGGGAYWTRYTYDDLRRVKTATAPNSGVATTVYAGTTTTTTDPLSHATAATIDADGEVATVTDAASHATHYAYDAFGDLLGATDPAGNVVAATYDSRGRKLTSSDPDMGAWSYGYDPLGELTSQVDPANGAAHPTTLRYDADGRVIERVEGTTASYTDWVYDGAAHGVGLLQASCTSAASNPTCTAPSTAKTFAYDTLSRPSSTTIAVDGTSYTYTTAYDANIGQVGTVSYPSGFVAAYGYTSLGYLATVKDNASGTALTTVNSANPAMQVTAATAGNGVTTTSTYDATTGLLTGEHAGASGAVAAFDYQYDVVGNLTYRDDTNQSVYEKFCYDALDRLTDSATAGLAPDTCTATGASVTNKHLVYDTVGDITSKNDVGTYSYPASGAARPHAPTGITGTVNGVTNPTYGYDANGNMTSGAGRTVTYTPFNMAASIVQGTVAECLTYDADHVRVSFKTRTSSCAGTLSQTIEYLDDPVSGAMSQSTITGATTTWRDDVRVGGQLIAERFCTGGAPCTSGASFKYFVVDHLGSSAVITDASGAVVERDSYDAWGRRRNSNGTDNPSCSITSATSRGYTGHEMLDSNCLINANARLYDPTLGQFQSPDSVVQAAYNGQSYARYSYVLNGPLSATDPTGYDAQQPDGPIAPVNPTPSILPGDDVTRNAAPDPLGLNPQLSFGDSPLGSLPGNPAPSLTGGVETVVSTAIRDKPAPKPKPTPIPQPDNARPCYPQTEAQIHIVRQTGQVALVGGGSATIVGGVVAVLSGAAEQPEGVGLGLRIMGVGGDALGAGSSSILVADMSQSYLDGSSREASGDLASDAVGNAAEDALDRALGRAAPLAGEIIGDIFSNRIGNESASSC